MKAKLEKYYKEQKIHPIELFCPCIPWEQIEMNLTRTEFKQFMKWMFGQTVPIGGVYEGDLKRWLNSTLLKQKEKNK